MALGTLQGPDLKAMNNIAKPGCKSHCGNITVPYPFGIGEGAGCSLDEFFYVTCNSTHFDPPKLFTGSSNIEIYNISVSESELRIFTSVSYKCYKRDGDVNREKNVIASKWALDLDNLDMVFFLSSLSLLNLTPPTLCHHRFALVDQPREPTPRFLCEVRCGCGLLFPEKEIGSTLWKKNNTKGSYDCTCWPGYTGNAKTPDGCQPDAKGSNFPVTIFTLDIDECDGKSNNSCYGHCINTAGSYNCTCRPGYTGNAKTPDGCQPIAKGSKFPVLTFTSGFGLTLDLKNP
ncbi:EGF-like calcium-binding [Artemisia annua]|uniref:EGF-like calcium-binding n=1 Tax=Artemisia annua TaxID=35608 RepID=A0A2U1P0W5_ARTAN|nr:EGF-like calcium-binding [Artemisia annua]